MLVRHVSGVAAFFRKDQPLIQPRYEAELSIFRHELERRKANWRCTVQDEYVELPIIYCNMIIEGINNT